MERIFSVMLRNVSNHFSVSAPAEWDVHILRGWNVCTMVLRYAELVVTDQLYGVMHFHSLTNVHFSYAHVDYCRVTICVSTLCQSGGNWSSNVQSCV